MGKCQDARQMASVGLHAATPARQRAWGGPLQTGAPGSCSLEGGTVGGSLRANGALWNASLIDSFLQGWSRHGRDSAGCVGSGLHGEPVCPPPHPLQGGGCSPMLSLEVVDRALSPAGEEDATGPGLSAGVAMTRGTSQGPAQRLLVGHGAQCQAGTANTAHRIPGTVTLGMAVGQTS